MRVLIVEDDMPIQALLSDLFQAEGYAVAAVGSGADALGALRGFAPDAIVLDLRLPDMDGRRIAEGCAARAVGAPVPIILVSAEPNLWHTAEQLRRFGVRGFVAKPFDVDALLSAVEDVTRP